jgi:hypothetical protein
MQLAVDNAMGSATTVIPPLGRCDADVDYLLGEYSAECRRMTLKHVKEGTAVRLKLVQSQAGAEGLARS